VADLLTCHRLARQVDQGLTCIDALVAITLDGRAQIGDRALLNHAKLTAARIAEMQADFDKLPPHFRLVDALDVGERFNLLDCTCLAVKDGFRSFANILNDGESAKGWAISLMDILGRTVVDWNVVLRMENIWCDRFLDAYRIPIRIERLKAIQSVEDDIRQLGMTIREKKSLVWDLLINPVRH